MRRRTARRLVVLVALAACEPRSGQGTVTGPPPGPSGAAGPTGAQGPPADPNATGGELYAALCASCHGAAAEGASGPALDRWTREREVLVTTIDARMPLGAPERCDRPCAEKIAGHVLGALQKTTPAPACDPARLPPRQLRLLTRREYDRTLRDLLRLGERPAPRACTRHDQCRWMEESCQAGTCTRDACNVHTFTFDPRARTPRSVVIAGSFNGWAATAQAGAWPMEPSTTAGRWIAKRELENGTHSYKIVVDGTEWLADETNPDSAPDGFGGRNSTLAIRCTGTAAPAPAIPDDFAAALPVESRPPGYVFDNAAAAGLVTAVHVTELMKAAETAAKLAVAGLAPCAERACAERFAAGFGERAFRRPLAPEEVAAYGAIAAGGLGVVAEAILSSPSFLYRSEMGAAGPDGAYTLDAWEMASALSYTFWGTMPDDALFAAAERGDLDTPEGIEREARRLLADPRAREQLGAFAVQWLGVEGLTTIEKAAPFSPEARKALLDEARALVTGAVLDGSHQLDALFTTPSDGGRRAGVLGLRSVLAAYAHSDQSSPIKRGVFVRERLLCQKFGVPPANAGGLPPVDPNATARERFSMHSANPACSGCHQHIDPIGFGFERFDALGQWRDTENGRPIDARGDLTDAEGFGAGTHARFETLAELGAILAASPRARACFATQYYRFARGTLESEDEGCSLEGVIARFAESGRDVRELMIAVARSTAFRRRR